MNESIQDMDALLDADMDSLDDLPPVGVPPTGHYNLEVTASEEVGEESGNAYIKFSYKVLAVNEVKDEAEASSAAEGMEFSQNFSPFKKDGTPNKFGIGFLKEACAPFSQHFGTPKVGDTIRAIDKIVVAATLVRKKDRKDPERFNFNLRDVVIL